MRGRELDLFLKRLHINTDFGSLSKKIKCVHVCKIIITDFFFLFVMFVNMKVSMYICVHTSVCLTSAFLISLICLSYHSSCLESHNKGGKDKKNFF